MQHCNIATYVSFKQERGSVTDSILPNIESDSDRKHPNLELQESHSFSPKFQCRFALALRVQDTFQWNTAG